MRFFFKVLVVLRRNGFACIFSRLNFYIYKLLPSSFKLDLDVNKHDITLLPMEIYTGSLSSKALCEEGELNEVLKFASFKGHFDKIKSLKRNECFRWSSFYPLYSYAKAGKDTTPLISYVEDWINEYLIKGKANQFCWYDMADSFRLIFIIYLYKKEFNNLSYSQSEMFKYAISLHSKVVSCKLLRAKGNHRIFQIYAEYLYKYYTGGELYSIENELLDYYNEQFTVGGVHMEHSPEYQIWATLLFKQIFEKLDLTTNTFAAFHKAQATGMEFFCVNKMIPLIGDSGLENSLVYWRLLNSWKRKEAFFNHDLGGYLIHRADKSGFYLIALFTMYSKCHKHNDSASFELTFRNKKIVTDSGKYSYDNDSFSKALRSFDAHNCINGRNLIINQCYVSKLLYESNSRKIILLQSNSSSCKHTRIFVSDEILGLIVIDVLSNQGLLLSGKYNSTLHFVDEHSCDEYFASIYGISSFSRSYNEYSEEYLTTKRGVRQEMVVESVSCFQLGVFTNVELTASDSGVQLFVESEQYSFWSSEIL